MPEALKPGKDVRRELGAAIHGEKILAQARKFVPKRVTTGSSTHQIVRYDLEKNAYCVIAKPLRALHCDAVGQD